MTARFWILWLKEKHNSILGENYRVKTVVKSKTYYNSYYSPAPTIIL